jgi:hypothetical protein
MQPKTLTCTKKVYPTIDSPITRLTSEQFYNLPSTDPNKLRLIFDLWELVHRLINSDIYENLAQQQDEQMKARSDWRENVFRK